MHPNDGDSILASNLRRAMAESGWKAAPLSTAAGLNQTFVRDILRGRAKRPAGVHLESLARVLGVAVHTLTGGAAWGMQPAPSCDAVLTNFTEAGSVTVSIPAGSPIQKDLPELVRLFARLPEAERQALLARMRPARRKAAGREAASGHQPPDTLPGNLRDRLAAWTRAAEDGDPSIREILAADEEVAHLLGDIQHPVSGLERISMIERALLRATQAPLAIGVEPHLQAKPHQETGLAAAPPLKLKIRK